MKKVFYLLFICVSCALVSCSQLYHFVQVFETQSADSTTPMTRVDNGLCYEDDDCAIYYYLWSDGGESRFVFYNKTDEIIYVDLAKSFFIRNGFASDYYLERTWSESNSKSVSVQTSSSSAAYASQTKTLGASAAYAGNFGHLPMSSMDPIATSASASKSASSGLLYASSVSSGFASSTASGISAKEKSILAIPPKSKKIVYEYAIGAYLVLDCDLERYPSEQASLSFSQDDSPLNFENYITYKVGNNEQEKVIENKFYVSKITNYAQPFILEFVKREKPCQNKTNEIGSNFKNEYPVAVYDQYIKIDTYNCFYLQYQKWSSHKLYKLNTGNYYYNSDYDGYTKEDASKYSFFVPSPNSSK